MRDKSLIGPIPWCIDARVFTNDNGPACCFVYPSNLFTRYTFDHRIITRPTNARPFSIPPLLFFFLFSFLLQISCNNIVIFTFLRSLLTKPLTRACCCNYDGAKSIFRAVDCSERNCESAFSKEKKYASLIIDDHFLSRELIRR